MRSLTLRVALLSTAVVLAGGVTSARAQITEVIGTRALGMGGAFTAVADDATAVYWNPAGMATGAYVSVVVDQLAHEFRHGDDSPSARVGVRGGGTLVGMTTPVIGVAYYRLAATGADLEDLTGTDLVTHHLALSLAQTLVEGVHVGATLRLVRGEAAAGALPPGTSALDEGWDAASAGTSTGTTRFDVDLGVMYDARRVRLALTARNLTEPSFPTAGGGPRLRMERTARVGVAVLPTEAWTVAVDADLATSSAGDAGRRRTVAAGVEHWWARRRLGVRGGVRAQTVDAVRGAVSVGGSALLGRGVNLDGELTRGGDDADRAWSVSARVSF